MVTEGRMSVGRVVIEGETTVGRGFVIDNAVICCSAGGEAVGEETDERGTVLGGEVVEEETTVSGGVVIDNASNPCLQLTSSPWRPEYTLDSQMYKPDSLFLPYFCFNFLNNSSTHCLFLHYFCVIFSNNR